jgi:type IV pilus assembly protein PilA
MTVDSRPLQEVDMFEALSKRLHRDEEGFTLIELMVVVLIIAILIAIAIPTFLGARSRAQDKQAQSNLRNALTAEKTFYTDSQVYTKTDTDLTPIESSLDYTTDKASTRGVFPEELVTGGQAVVLRSWSSSGTTFCLLDIVATPAAAVHGETTAGTYYAKVSPGTSMTTTCATATYGNSW